MASTYKGICLAQDGDGYIAGARMVDALLGKITTEEIKTAPPCTAEQQAHSPIKKSRYEMKP